MRTVEAVLGVLIMAIAVALSFGAAGFFVPLPPPGLGPTLALVFAGAAVATHGMAGRAASSAVPGAALRWRTATYALLAITGAAALPLAVEVLDLVTVAGFPLGYFLAAQGLLVLFAIVAFRAAQSLDRLDARDGPPPASGDR
jgi:putative solute:sodium symporter small subunit